MMGSPMIGNRRVAPLSVMTLTFLGAGGLERALAATVYPARCRHVPWGHGKETVLVARRSGKQGGHTFGVAYEVYRLVQAGTAPHDIDRARGRSHRHPLHPSMIATCNGTADRALLNDLFGPV